MSTPASSLRRVASRQVANGSIQACTSKRWRPTATGVNVASHRSSPAFTLVMGTSSQPLVPLPAACGGSVRHHHVHPVVAVGEHVAPTVTGSPTTRLAG